MLASKSYGSWGVAAWLSCSWAAGLLSLGVNHRPRPLVRTLCAIKPCLPWNCGADRVLFPETSQFSVSVSGWDRWVVLFGFNEALKQRFPNLGNAHVGYLGLWLECRFWSSKSGTGLKTLHLEHAPR